MAGLRILIADDHADVRDALRELFEARGHVVVADVAAAAEVAPATAASSPDLVLLDVFLGSANGLEVAAELTARSPELAVVLMSVDQVAVSAEAISESGARGLVRKHQLASLDISELLRPS